MSSRPLIKESLFLLNIFGLLAPQYNYLNQSRVVFAIFVIALGFVTAFLECVIHFDGLNSVETVTASVGIYQLLVKLCTLIAHRKSILELLNKMDTFWDIDKYGFQLSNEIKNIYNSTKQIMKFMTALFAVLLIGFSLQPAFGKTRSLFYKSIYPQDMNQSPEYELALSSQLLLMFVATFVLLGFDGLLISLIIHIVCELKLLKKGFESVPIDIKVRGNMGETLAQLYHMVDHHNLILECIKIMRKIYSVLLLNVYLFNMTCICVGLLGVIVSGLPPTVESMTKYGAFTVFYTLQLFFYCETGNHLTNECQSVSATVYNTDWWIKTQPELRKVYVLIILRANKLEELTAGGMFSLSLDSFRKVLKGALSFFTLVEALYKDETMPFAEF